MNSDQTHFSQHSFSRRELLAGALSSSTIAQTVTPMGAANAAQTTGATANDPEAVISSWNQVRAQWVLNPRLAYFDTARFAPSTRAMLVAEYRALEALHSDPQAFFREQYSAAAVQSLCNRLGRWLDCSADELCFMRDAAHGLQHYAQQLSLQAGDEVIIHTQLPQVLRDFWNEQARNRGLVVKSVDLPVPLLNSAQVLAAFENALSERSRVLMCSHVQTVDGAILPVRELAALARSRGVLSLVDGSFSLGALQFSLRELGCDVYGSSFAHWLNGSAATGVLYVRRELHTTLNATYRTEQQPQLDTQAWPHLAGLWPDTLISAAAPLQALPLALEFQEKLGRPRIETRLLELQTYARLQVQTLADLEVLTPTQAGMYLHLLTVRSGKRSAEQLASWLRNNDQVIVSGMSSATANPVMANVLRISLSIYNSYDDIDRLVLGLRRALRA